MIEGGNGFLASWITNGTAKPFYARKEFEISEKPVSAKAYVCGLGQFIFRINGEKVGDHELDPGWTDYRKYVQYVTFDILPYLKLGANAAGAEVGNGWYIMKTGDGHYSFHFPEFMPPNPNGYTPFGESLILAVRMEIGYADGSAQVVETDSSWKTAKHPVVSSNVYGSEKTDGRFVQKEWDTAGLDDSAWAQAKTAEGLDGKYARENVETAFLYADAKVLAEFAEILGKKEDCRKFLDYAEQVRKNYNEKLLVYDEEKKRYCYRLWENEDEIQMTQAAEALPLYWGLVPEECREDVAGAFREVLLRDGSFRCGEVGQPYVIQTAADCGMNDLIGEYIVKETHPSYYAFVLEGETTLGEYWESNPRSHCHDMMGHIIEWYYNGIAGIRPLEPGFKKVLVKPYLPESMDRVDCIYHSVSGDIHVSMRRREDRSVELHVEADSAIECEVCRENL